MSELPEGHFWLITWPRLLALKLILLSALLLCTAYLARKMDQIVDNQAAIIHLVSVTAQEAMQRDIAVSKRLADLEGHLAEINSAQAENQRMIGELQKVLGEKNARRGKKNECCGPALAPKP